jgi:hypothetical protein
MATAINHLVHTTIPQILHGESSNSSNTEDGNTHNSTAIDPALTSASQTSSSSQQASQYYHHQSYQHSQSEYQDQYNDYSPAWQQAQLNPNRTVSMSNIFTHRDTNGQQFYLIPQDFVLIKTLGTGTFARVSLAKLARPATPQDAHLVFALKVLRKTDVIRLRQVEHVVNERNVLAKVAGHPFITHMIASFQDHDSLYMLLEYCPGGEVFSYLRRARRFNEQTSRFYAAEIVLILEYLHGKEGVAYRDLKPENILIDAEGHLKLVDFGFAKKMDNRETSIQPCNES